MMVLASRGLPSRCFRRAFPVVELWDGEAHAGPGSQWRDLSIRGHCGKGGPAPAAACRLSARVGKRGSGAGAAVAHPGRPRAITMTSADCHVMTICVVEEVSAGSMRIDAIAATPGVDAIFIGTSDLSFSMGLRGNSKERRSWNLAIARIGGRPPNVTGSFLGPPGGGMRSRYASSWAQGFPSLSDAHRNRLLMENGWRDS